MRHVRLSLKAIVIKNGRLLVLKHRGDNGQWFSLPGGGQEHGETIPEALSRECLEEIGTGVTVGRLRFVRGYISAHHEFAATGGGAHQVELMFECRLTERPTIGTVPDAMQTGIEWLEIAALSRHPLYPAVLRDVLPGRQMSDGVIYLGDVN